MLQEYSFKKLQDRIGVWLSKAFEVLSISISRSEVKAIVYVKDDEQGIDFSYSYEMDKEARDYTWLGNTQALEKILEPLAVVLHGDGYTDDKIKVIVTLEDYAFTERLDLPELERKDLEEALNWEVPEHVPWDKGSYSFQYLIKKYGNINESQLGNDVLAKLQQVYIYAAENDCVETLLKAINNVGWELVGITVAEALTLGEDSDKMKLIEFYGAHYTEEQLAERREAFIVPIMTAVAYGTAGLAINFLPKEDKYRVRLTEYQEAFKVLSCVCWGVSLLVSGMAYGYHYKEASELEMWQMKERTMAVWKERIQEMKQLQAKEQSLNKQIKLLEAKKLPWSGVMKDLGHLMPQGAWLTKINQQAEMDAENIKRVSIVLQGQAQSSELVAQLLQRLEQSNNLHRIELINSGTETKGDKNFSEQQMTSFTIKAEFQKPVTDTVDGKLDGKNKYKGINRNSNVVKKEV